MYLAHAHAHVSVMQRSQCTVVSTALGVVRRVNGEEKTRAKEIRRNWGRAKVSIRLLSGPWNLVARPFAPTGREQQSSLIDI